MNFYRFILHSAVCLTAAIVFSGCGAGTMTSIDHAPPYYLNQSTARPATVCVASTEDKREDTETTDCTAMFIMPGSPFGWNHNGSGIAEGKGFLNEAIYKPSIEIDVLSPLMTKYMRDTRIFSNAVSSKSSLTRSKSYNAPDEADYVVFITVDEWDSTHYTLSYGVSFGIVYCTMAGLPIEFKTGEYTVSYSLFDVNKQKVILYKEYESDFIGKLEGAPWGYMFYGWWFDELLENLRDSVKEDMSDFASEVNRLLPPASNTKFYTDLGYKRAVRVAEGHGNNNSLFYLSNVYPADKMKISQRYVKPIGQVNAKIPMTKVTAYFNDMELNVPAISSEALSFDLSLLPELKLVDRENSLELYFEAYGNRKHGFEFTIYLENKENL